LRSHLLHRMYWSPADLALFIAVQDVVNGTVLTILTLEMYQERSSIVITDRQIGKVVNEAVLAGDAPTKMWVPDERPSIRVCAGLSDTEAVTVGYWNGLEAPDLEAVGSCRQFWEWLMRKLGDRGYQVANLEWVS